MTSIVSAPTTITVTSPNTGTSVLARTAASMAPGTWAQLATNNIVPTLGQTGGASGFVFGYADKAVWDSTSRRIFYVGSDHFAPGPGGPRFVQYDDATNTWSMLIASWLPSLTSTA